MRPSERFPRAGFTLLEVMAAVAVLGLVYVVVARGAMQGLQTEGDASRRLRASLLADRVLNDLELSLAGGSAPALGETETSEEEFTVVVEVSPFDLASLLEAANGEAAGPASLDDSPRAPEAPGPRRCPHPAVDRGTRGLDRGHQRAGGHPHQLRLRPRGRRPAPGGRSRAGDGARSSGHTGRAQEPGTAAEPAQ